MEKTGKYNMTRTVCPFHDAHNCGLMVHTENGVIKRITPGNFPESKYKGACIKGLSAHHWIYHRDRLRHPLKRIGNRGEGKWQKISWETALDEIAHRLKSIAEKYGSSSVAWSMPEFPLLKRGGYSRLASLTRGTCIDMWGFGDLAGPNADLVTFGSLLGGMLGASSVRNPKFSIAWGINPADTEHHKMRDLLKDKKNGCHIVVIDPRFTNTAAKADEHIPIRPGTDGALALGMIHIIQEKGLWDKNFVREKTVGPFLVRSDNGQYLRKGNITSNADEKAFMVWDAGSGSVKNFQTPDIAPSLLGRFKIAGIDCRPAYQCLIDMAKEYTPGKTSEITEIPEKTIIKLAERYAVSKPAAIHRGFGMQRTFYGDLNCRAINALAAITGNLSFEFHPTLDDLAKPGERGSEFSMPAGPYNRIPVMQLYEAITTEEPFPIKALCFAMHNYVNQLPNTNKIINELLPRIELMIVCDLFMNETARYADYVLPATSHFECTDILPGTLGRTPYIQLQKKVIEPLFESKSDFRIAAELGRRMGFGDYFDKTEEAYMAEILASEPALSGITLEQLESGPVKQPHPANPPVRTASGRIEFYVEGFRHFNQELPVYMEPVESRRREKARQYSLSLLTPHSKYRLHSTFANVPALLKYESEPVLEIQTEDAKARGIRDGDTVTVYNDRGSVKVKAKVVGRIKPGIVSLTQGWWPKQYLAGHNNSLTQDFINPVQALVAGPNAALYDVLVEVKKTDGSEINKGME